MVFVHKSKFFLFVFFGEIKSENIVFEILDKKEQFLDQKNKVFKRAKQGDFPKGIIHSFLSKNRNFSYLYFLEKSSQKILFFDILEKNRIIFRQEK